jgi:hypothetical protein
MHQLETQVRTRTHIDGIRAATPLVLVDRVPVLEWSTDRRLRLTCAKGKRFPDLGLVPADLVGARVSEAFGRVDPEPSPIEAHIRALEGESIHCRIRWGGRILEAEIEPRLSSEGQVVGTRAVAFDVTEVDQAGVTEARGRAAVLPRHHGRTGAVVARIH